MREALLSTLTKPQFIKDQYTILRQLQSVSHPLLPFEAVGSLQLI
jgi:hypothetical protein